MALSTKNETHLSEFILPGQTALLLSKHIEAKIVYGDYYRIILGKIYTFTHLKENCNSNFTCKFFENSLVLIRLNICFRNKKFDNLYNLLSFLELSPSIVAISKTRLKINP